MLQFSRKCSLKNEPFSRKRLCWNKQSDTISNILKNDSKRIGGNSIRESKPFKKVFYTHHMVMRVYTLCWFFFFFFDKNTLCWFKEWVSLLYHLISIIHPYFMHDISRWVVYFDLIFRYSNSKRDELFTSRYTIIKN